MIDAIVKGWICDNNQWPKHFTHLDEAGDTYFGNSGTKYFFYTGLILTGDGFPLHRALLECRYATLAAQGRFSNSHEGNDYFHATEDSLETRENVFCVLKAHSDDVRAYATVLKKGALPLDHQTPEKLFEAAAENLLSAIISAEDHNASYEHISVMLDSIPVQKAQGDYRHPQTHASHHAGWKWHHFHRYADGVQKRLSPSSR